MKNFAKKSFTEKKTWGVLGKIQEFYSPEQFQDETRIVPMNANPLEAWDSTRSRYRRRVQGPLPNDGQQAGVVPQGTPSPDVTPTPTASAPVTPTPTSSITPTPTLTPSSTPLPLPETPSLWYDATNVGSIDYITSGGTNYVANWRSIGVYQKTLSAATVNTAPVWSGSSQMPGSPNVVRFVGSTVSGTTKYLSQRFDSTLIPQSGGTYFIVMASPTGATYGTTASSTFGFTARLMSGNTTTGGFSAPQPNTLNTIFSSGNNAAFSQTKQGVITNNAFPYTATNINNKFLVATTLPFPTGFMEMEINQSGYTSPNFFTGSTANTFNQFAIGATYLSAGTFSANATNNSELGEFMFYNRVLTQAEIEAVQNYLRDKWRYDEWASPVPTPTPTDTPNPTPTPSITPTNTNTPSPTPPFNPNNIPDLFQWFDTSVLSNLSFRSSGGVNFITGWTGRTGGSFTQTTASAQPYMVNISGYTFSGASFFGTKWLLNNTISAATPSGTTTFVVGYNDFDSFNAALVWDAGTPEGVSSAYLSGNVFQIRGVGRIKGYNAYSSLTKQPRYIAWGYAFNGTDGAGNINGVSFNADYGSFTPPASITQMRMSTSDTGNDNGGAVYEILMYNRTLTTAEINSVVSYLQNKWGYSSW